MRTRPKGNDHHRPRCRERAGPNDPNVARGLVSAAAWSWRVLVVAGATALGVLLFWVTDNDGPLQLDGSSGDHAPAQVGPAPADAGKVLFGGVLGGASLLVELISGTVPAPAFLIYLLTDGEHRRSVNLHPPATPAAVTAGGIVGALIAVPVVAFPWALLDEHDRIVGER